MPIIQALADFKADLAQCDSLIANAHQVTSSGSHLFSSLDRKQITVAAFLNMFIAWESFIETTIVNFMVGERTIRGNTPARFVAPLTPPHAKRMLIGTMKYFDYANHEYLRKMANVYFDNGYPFEPHISSIFTDLADLKTMRNASAHISSTTQAALEGVAARIFGQPRTGITLYELLVSIDPRSTVNETVFLLIKTSSQLGQSLLRTAN